MKTQIIDPHELRRFKSDSANATCHLLQDRKLRGDHPGYVGCVEACDPVLFMSLGLECGSGPKMEVQTGPGGKVKEWGGEEGDRIRDGQLRTLRHLTLFSSWETGTQRKRVKNEGHFTKTVKIESNDSWTHIMKFLICNVLLEQTTVHMWGNLILTIKWVGNYLFIPNECDEKLLQVVFDDNLTWEPIECQNDLHAKWHIGKLSQEEGQSFPFVNFCFL